jgi:hypothetical protein
MPTFRNTVCSTFIGLWRWNRQSVPKRWHLDYRRRGISQNKAYDIRNKAKVWNQEIFRFLLTGSFVTVFREAHHWSLSWVRWTLLFHFFKTHFQVLSQNCEKWLLALLCLSVCLSTWNRSVPSGRILMRFYIWVFFETLSRKIQVLLKSGKNNGYFTWTPLYIFYCISLISS